MDKFTYGVSDRGASVRIPWQVALDKKGYIEDRRPNANMDPYVVTRLITDTVCSAFDAAGTNGKNGNGAAKVPARTAVIAKASKNGAGKKVAGRR